MNLKRSSLFLSSLMVPLSLPCQTATLPPLPNDPVTLMSLAREKNGLNTQI